jgi:hypothetical protein
VQRVRRGVKRNRPPGFTPPFFRTQPSRRFHGTEKPDRSSTRGRWAA